MNNRLEINVFDLSDVTSKLLLRLLLRKQKHGRVLKKGKTYWLGLQRICLSHDVMIRQKFPGKWHYDVIEDNDCGAGKFGSAHMILSVLSQQKLKADPKEKRLYKIQDNAAITEFALMRRCPHLYARELFSGVPSYITMRKLPGVLLSDALNHERNVAPFTHAQRYRLTVSLLRALKKQMHDNMICHCDIKPNNIFYDEKNGEINIFDLGISRLIGDSKDNRSRGNATFSAPEEFISVITGKPVNMSEFRVGTGVQNAASVDADIYSMARVIGLVWRDSDPVFFITEIDHTKLMKRRINDNWQPNFVLYQNLPSVGDAEKIKIEEILRHMTALNPFERPSLQNCIEYFDHLFLSYKLTKTPVIYHEMMTVSHQLALQVQARLDEMEQRQDLSIRVSECLDDLEVSHDTSVTKFTEQLSRKFSHEHKVMAIEISKKYLCLGCDPDLSMREFISYLKKTSSLQVMVSYLKTSAAELPDHPRAVIEFIETLDVKAFFGITSRAALLDKIDEITRDFTDNLQSLLQRYDDMRESHHADAAELHYLLNSLAAERMTIDNIQQSARHIQHKLQKISDEQHHAALRVSR